MDDGSMLVAWARERAHALLAPLGDRWLHVQAAAEAARRVGGFLAPRDRADLVAAAYLHDVGYARPLAWTGFHPLDGARMVRAQGHERLARLIAHHSEARFEAAIRGLDTELAAFPRERSATADALTYCDLTTGPAGQPLTLPERVAEILDRYGDGHVVSCSVRRALPHLARAVERTEARGGARQRLPAARV